MRIVVRTNRNWHDFKCRAEVPKKFLLTQFDWMIPKEIRNNFELVKAWCKGEERAELEDISGDYWDGFFKYQGYWYHTADFMRTPTDSPLGTWEGYKSESMTTGIVVNWNDDCDRYQVGSYCTVSE